MGVSVRVHAAHLSEAARLLVALEPREKARCAVGASVHLARGGHHHDVLGVVRDRRLRIVAMHHVIRVGVDDAVREASRGDEGGRWNEEAHSSGVGSQWQRR